MPYQQNALLVAITWICFSRLHGNAIIGQIVIKCKCLTNRNKSKGFQKFLDHFNLLLSSFESHVTTLVPMSQYIWATNLFPKPKFSSNQLKEEAQAVTTPWSTQYRPKQLLRKSPILPYATGGNFSFGIESMIQSKIAVGYKKYSLSHPDYKTVYFVLWAIFLVVDFHWGIKSLFWRIIFKGGYST